MQLAHSQHSPIDKSRTWSTCLSSELHFFLASLILRFRFYSAQNGSGVVMYFYVIVWLDTTQIHLNKSLFVIEIVRRIELELNGVNVLNLTKFRDCNSASSHNWYWSCNSSSCTQLQLIHIYRCMCLYMNMSGLHILLHHDCKLSTMTTTTPQYTRSCSLK